jgi:hypothetical protein
MLFGLNRLRESRILDGHGLPALLMQKSCQVDTSLFFTRMSTTPSRINVNIILSPALIPRPSRIGLGMVVCPLAVGIASVLMAISGFPCKR